MRLRLLLQGIVTIASLYALTAFAQIQYAVPDRFVRPSQGSEEGGLWERADREEVRMKRSPLLVQDPQLTAYLTQLYVNLAGAKHASDIRIYVLRQAAFNAFIAPNGMLFLSTGLLLRIQNEAQLAAVIGHEMGHYFERHTLARLKLLKNKGAIPAAFAFGRENETQADRIGMLLLQNQGYDGKQAIALWDNLLAEMKVIGGDKVGAKQPYTATHPAVDTRKHDLSQLLTASADQALLTRKVDAVTYQNIIAPHRIEWIFDEIKRGQMAESLAVFDRLLMTNPLDAQVLFGKAEVLRLRGQNEDLKHSQALLIRAVELPTAPAQAYRSLGYLLRDHKQTAQAAEAFETYLKRLPSAADAALIRHTLLELQP